MIGTTYPSFVSAVDELRIQAFARVIGSDDPIYFDAAAALRAGHERVPECSRSFWSR